MVEINIPMFEAEDMKNINEEYESEELLNELIRFEKEHGRSPMVRDFVNNPEYPNYSTYISRFGSWNNAIRDAGLIPNIMTNVTDNELLEFLRKFYKENGRSPMVKDFINNPGYPGPKVYVNHFGSWNNAIREAGLVHNRCTDKKDDKEKKVILPSAQRDHMNMLLVPECEVKDISNRTPKLSNSYSEYEDVMRKLEQTSYNENPYCNSYLSEFIGQYVRIAVGADNLPYTTVILEGKGAQPKPVDWLLNWKGRRLKVKHISSCLRKSGKFGSLFWRYVVGFNNDVDAFILSAFDTREFLEPQYIWMVEKGDIVGMGFPKEEFWNNRDFILLDNVHNISMMMRYELKEPLEKLRVIMKRVCDELKEENKEDIQKILLKRRNDILMSTGKRVSIRELAEKAIINGINKIDHDM